MKTIQRSNLVQGVAILSGQAFIVEMELPTVLPKRSYVDEFPFFFLGKLAVDGIVIGDLIIWKHSSLRPKSAVGRVHFF